MNFETPIDLLIAGSKPLYREGMTLSGVVKEVHFPYVPLQVTPLFGTGTPSVSTTLSILGDRNEHLRGNQSGRRRPRR